MSLSAHHRCTYAYLNETSNELDYLSITERFTSIGIPAQRHKTFKAKLLAPGFLHYDGVTKFAHRAAYSQVSRKTIEQVIDHHDVVMFTHPWSWPALKDIPSLADKFVIYDSHNVESVLAAEVSGPWLQRTSNHFLVKRLEQQLCERSDLILTCTEEDKGFYVERFGIPATKIHAGFKGVHCQNYAAEPAGFAERERAALFVGSNWYPNNQAAARIVNELAPALPSFKWLLAGTCTKRLPLSFDPNVQRLGFVDDLLLLMNRALVAVNPMTEGSGINMKMMDYMAAGLPVVTTEFGARGITGEARDALIIVDLPSFPKAIEDLANDPVRWQTLSRRARESAMRQFDWNTIAQRLDGLIMDGLKQAKSTQAYSLLGKDPAPKAVSP